MQKIYFLMIYSITLILFGCTTSEPTEENIQEKHQTQPITQEKLDKIEALNNFYSKSLTTVYYQHSGGMGQDPTLKELEGADASTFDVFDPMDNIHFAKDKNYVYRDGIKIEGLDGASFEFIFDSHQNPIYAKDNQHVYIVYDDMLSRKGSLGDFEKLTEADPANFTFIEHNNCATTPARYAHDNKNAYFGSEKIEEANGKTFKHLAYGLAKDDHQVYFLGNMVPGADAATFESLVQEGEVKDCSKVYARDKDYVYNCFNECVAIHGIDPKTFQVPND